MSANELMLPVARTATAARPPTAAPTTAITNANVSYGLMVVRSRG
jgi:hypothetical protein